MKMRVANIQDKKLNIIEQLIIINDESVFDQVETIINNSLQRPNLKKFTKSELIHRAKLANLDIENNDIISQEQVELISQDWRDYNLQDDEVELLESIESCEWKSIENIDERRNNLRAFFSKNNDSEKMININLDKDDFDSIINKSNQYGMNYKELIEKLVHNFAIGKIML
jgi:predicted DNA binding CopG/RHH family protein